MRCHEATTRNACHAAKRKGRRLRARCAEDGINLTHALSLEIIARAYGYAHWNDFVDRKPKRAGNDIEAHARLRQYLEYRFGDERSRLMLDAVDGLLNPRATA
ncbi:glyoxalase superfamily protein [Salinisphaera sp. P385]|uniref:Glyoxalase superfamily protein n=1 Tax=Spectribacter acetivorans TaxID=3075603 RepID=A0ABU3B7S5_9GAMM|nr:glyoxalase superfamily protein [Salinisphaera sp. P385]MDT0618517.1 glyoxalase superfamily protein [Salinisphaera sp. P385]